MNDRIKAQEALINTYEAYIELLGEEIAELAPVAHQRLGWQSSRHEDGKLLRDKIKNFKEVLAK